MYKTIIIVLIGILSFQSVSVEGLICYSCNFFQGMTPPPGELHSEPSCKLGETPDKSFAINCEDPDNFNHGYRWAVPGGASKHGSDRLQDKEKWIFSCFTFNLNGKMKMGLNVNFTMRSCLARTADSALSSSIPEKCHTNSDIDMETREDAVVAILLPTLSIFSDETEAEVCTCSVDNCNGFKKVHGRKIEMGQLANEANNSFNALSYVFVGFAFSFYFAHFVDFVTYFTT